MLSFKMWYLVLMIISPLSIAPSPLCMKNSISIKPMALAYLLLACTLWCLHVCFCVDVAWLLVIWLFFVLLLGLFPTPTYRFLPRTDADGIGVGLCWGCCLGLPVLGDVWGTRQISSCVSLEQFCHFHDASWSCCPADCVDCSSWIYYCPRSKKVQCNKKLQISRYWAISVCCWFK